LSIPIFAFFEKFSKIDKEKLEPFLNEKIRVSPTWSTSRIQKRTGFEKQLLWIYRLHNLTI